MNNLPLIKPELVYLFVGNSRWHWAFKEKKQKWKFISSSSESENNFFLNQHTLSAWGAVGKVPKNVNFDPKKEICLKDIPLKNAPPWLGIDRAIVGYGAYELIKNSSDLTADGLIVADAGTVFSLTKINSRCEFEGGQLAAGINLQLHAMSNMTKNLKYPSKKLFNFSNFPSSTDEAMLKGTLNSIVSMINQIQEENRALIFICGGDSNTIFDNIKKDNLKIFHKPNLLLETLINLKKLN